MENDVRDQRSFFLRNKEIILLFLFSFVVRAITATLGSPHSYHSDEHWIFAPAFKMVQEKSWDLDWFRVPPLLIMMYKQLIAFLQMLAPTNITLPKESWFDPLSIMPSQFPLLYVGRLLVSFFASVSVVTFFLILRRVVSWKLAFLFSILYSSISSVVFYSSFLRPEPLVIFFLLGSVYFLINYEENGKSKNIVTAGAAFGFACACKYNAAFFLLTAFLYLFLINHNLKVTIKNTLYYIASALVLFIISVPHLFWKLTSVVEEVSNDYAYYKQGDLAFHSTKFENFIYYLFTLYRPDSFFILFWLFVITLCLIVFFRKKISQPFPRVAYVSCFFVVSYILFLSSFSYTAERNVTFVYPFVLIPVAVTFGLLNGRTDKRFKQAAVALLIIVSTTTAYYLGRFLWRAHQPLPQDQVLAWIDQNAPKKSFILREISTPLIDPRNYAVLYYPNIATIRPNRYCR